MKKEGPTPEKWRGQSKQLKKEEEYNERDKIIGKNE
jgi:hypothetical protein